MTNVRARNGLPRLSVYHPNWVLPPMIQNHQPDTRDPTEGFRYRTIEQQESRLELNHRNRVLIPGYHQYLTSE